MTSTPWKRMSPHGHVHNKNLLAMYKFHRNLWGKFKMRELNSLGIWMSGFHIFSTGFRVELGPDHRHEWAGTAPVPASAQQKCELLTQQETIVYKCSNEDMVNDFLQMPFLKSSANSHTGSAPSQASDGELSLQVWS